MHTRTKPTAPHRSQCSVSWWRPQPGSCRIPQLAPGTANPGLLSRDSRLGSSAVHTPLMKVLSLPFPVSSDPDRLTLLTLRMLIFPLSTISKPKQHLELQLAIQRETDYNWKKLHISFPSFTCFCFYPNFPHVPSKTAPQGEELSPLERLPNTM